MGLIFKSMNRQNIHKLVSFFCLLIVAVFIFASPLQALAEPKTTEYGLSTTLNNTQGKEALRANSSVPDVIGKIVGAALAFVGVLFFLLMIYGGFTWMMARGNEQDVTKAKDLIIAAVIGLAIVLAAYAITAYIGSALTAS